VIPHEVIDPAAQELEDKVDPFVKGLVARDLEKGMGAMMIYAQRLSEDPFWPIGLCVAWVLWGRSVRGDTALCATPTGNGCHSRR
jgi:hypothetical protein